MAKPEKSLGVGGRTGRFRTLLFFFGALIIVVGLMSYLYYVRQVRGGGLVTGAEITKPPTIGSVPGEATSAQYARSIQKENIQQAKTAEETGGSAIATISRASFQGGSEFEEGTSTKPGCSMAELRNAREAGVKASELKCRGCSAKDLRAVGYTAAELADAGYSAADLKAAGFNALELRDAGFSAAELRAAGFRADELKAAGFSPAELAQAGFSKDDLLAAGFSQDEVNKAMAGLALKTADCSKDALTKARKSGVKAIEIKDCGAAALRAAGYTAAELKAAGFSAKELKAAGFSAGELKAAGYTAGELRRAGYTAAELHAAGYAAKELRTAGFSPGQLRAAGFTPDQMHAAGFTDGDLIRAGYTKAEIAQAACSTDSLKQAKARNMSLADLADRHCSAAQLRSGGYSDAELAAAGISEKKTCTPEFLQQARAQNASAATLAVRGCTADQLKAAGYNDNQIAAVVAAQKNPCSPENLKEMRAQNMDSSTIAEKGCTAAQLQAAGFSNEEIAAINAAGAASPKAACTPEFLKEARAQNVSPSMLAKLGCRPEQVVAAGYSAKEVANPCGTEAMKADLARGLSPEQIIERGCSPAQLHAAGLPATTAEAAEMAKTSSAEARLDDLERKREAKLTADERRDALDRAKQSMENASTSMFESWVPPATQVMIVAPEPKDKDREKKEGGPPAGEQKQTSKAGGPVVAKAPGSIIKAGTVMYGVIDTGVNSDEKSPILATIVSGPLKGAKLVGDFATVSDKVVLSFSVMNAPQFESSVPLKAVAIDQDTARTALASKVDYHYWLRYGGLFASSFLSGFGQAVSSSGQQSSSGAGGLVVTNSTLNTAQKVAVALGRVGTEYAAQLGQTFTTPPTVTVDAGTSIGILFMADVTLPGKI